MSAPVRRVAISHLRPAVPSVCDSVRLLLPLPLLALAAVPTGFGQSGANSDAIYSALRNAPLGTEAVRVTDLKLKRDAGTFHLHSGTVCFVAPVNGKVTGKSEHPQTVAGFNFGKFKVVEAKLTSPDVLIQSFANEDPPNWVQSLQTAASGNLPGQRPAPGVSLGSMDTTLLNKKALTEGELAVQLYSDYFGSSSFTQIHITQQTVCSFGQSVARTRVDSDLLLLRYDRSSPARYRLGRPRLLEGGHPARGRSPVVGPHGGV